MDNSHNVEQERFLKYLGKPFKSFCMIFSLRFGVTFIAAFDILIGIISFIAGLIHFIELFVWDIGLVSIYIKFINCLATLVAVPFAVLGIKGIYSSELKNVRVYSNYKIFEFFLIAGILIIKLMYDERKEEFESIINFLAFLLLILERLILLMLVKVVWSAYIRLKYSQILLVNQGEEPSSVQQDSEESNHIISPSVIDLPSISTNRDKD
jgi:hypothetical protein